MKRYWNYIKPYWIYFLLAPLLMLLEVYCDVQLPTLAANIINEGIMAEDNATILSIALQMVITLCVATGAGVISSFCSIKASTHFSHDLREDVFARIQEFSFKNIDKFSTGSLVTRLTNDVTQVGQMITKFLRAAFRAPGMLIGAIIMAYALSPSLSTIFVVLAPILVGIIAVVIYFAYPKFALLQDKIDALNTTVQEGLINIRVIKAFTRERYQEERFQEVNHALRDTGLRAYRINILQGPLMTLAINTATMTILWFGSQALGRGEILIGDISAFITYLTQISMAVNMLANVFMQSSRSMVSAKRLSAVLDEEIDINDVSVAAPEKRVTSGDIVFEDVSFKYFEKSEDAVLSHLNLTIKSGQTVGIVGSTGCGKTSFVHLIPRLYDVSAGRVLVDGVDVRDYTLEHLRDGVAMVLQHNLLFSGSVKDNLLWGNHQATTEEMVAATEYAAARDFIEETTQQYDTLINQGGLNLSGGQKQRLCIARALMKEAKILILDDSTSAVDTETERTIRHHLAHDLKTMTKIIIAQRISSVEYADMIVVLDDGKISATGTHEALLAHSSVYQEIYRSQVDGGDMDEVNHGN